MAETKRCLDEYAAAGNFTLMPLVMNDRGNGLLVGDWRYEPMTEYWESHNNLAELRASKAA